MTFRIRTGLLPALLLPAMLLSGCSAAGGGGNAAADAARATIPLTIDSTNGRHAFRVERAVTEAEQQKGLMYRTDLTDDGGMLFWPYPPSGAARVANFWMKNTPSPLDILFIRADGTIAHIADNTTPFSEDPISSEEPVGAVLEIKGGRAAALGIAEGDRVSWAK